MKKALSILLATLLVMFSLGTAATATPADRSLQFTPPAIIGIEAAWNGNFHLNTWDLSPQFSASNVDITAHFEGGTYEVLQNWHMDFWAAGHDLWFFIQQRMNMDTHTVTFYFVDNAIANAYWTNRNNNSDINGSAAITPACGGWCCCDFPDTMLETVPASHRASITFPADYIEQALANAVEIGLNEAVTVAVGFNVFTFALETQGGTFVFFNDDESNDFSFTVFNSELEQVANGGTWSGSNGARVTLEGYDIYYILVNTWRASMLSIRPSTLSTSISSATIGANGGWVIFDVIYTSEEWTQSTHSNWLRPYRTTDGDVHVLVERNPNSWSRSGTVTITSDCGEVINVNVTQAGNPNSGNNWGILDILREIFSFMPDSFGSGLLVGIGSTLLIVLIVTVILTVWVASTVFGWVGGFFRWVGGWFN